jgi:hypothetical protein
MRIPSTPSIATRPAVDLARARIVPKVAVTAHPPAKSMAIRKIAPVTPSGLLQNDLGLLSGIFYTLFFLFTIVLAISHEIKAFIPINSNKNTITPINVLAIAIIMGPTIKITNPDSIISNSIKQRKNILKNPFLCINGLLSFDL